MPKLTVKEVQNAKAGRHGDGGGLYLYVKPTGSKSWVLRVMVDGKRTDYGLGAVDLIRREGEGPDIPLGQRKLLTLGEARKKAAEARLMAKAGLNPSFEWAKAGEKIPTFQDTACQLCDAVKGGWRNEKHATQWLTSLEQHAFGAIGDMRVDAIEAPDIQRALVPIWLTIPETARRVRQRIGAVLDFAHGKGWRTAEAPRRAVNQLMKRIKQPKGSSFAAMPYSDVPDLMKRLRADQQTVGRMALQFTILTAVRSGEARGATWGEFDLSKVVWTIPAERMKMEEAHSVPLSPAVVAILEEVSKLSAGKSDEIVFPGNKGNAMSDATLAKVLKVHDGGNATVHGMRSAFRDWCAEQTSFPDAWAEAALAHALPKKTEAAYRRTKYLDQRRKLMVAWADYCAGSSNVISLAEARA